MERRSAVWHENHRRRISSFFVSSGHAKDGGSNQEGGDKKWREEKKQVGMQTKVEGEKWINFYLDWHHEKLAVACFLHLLIFTTTGVRLTSHCALVSCSFKKGSGWLPATTRKQSARYHHRKSGASSPNRKETRLTFEFMVHFTDSNWNHGIIEQKLFVWLPRALSRLL